jgi:hypothetical protein
MEYDLDQLLPDERCHVDGSNKRMEQFTDEHGIVYLNSIPFDFHSEKVFPEITMRFDVQLGYIRPMIADGTADVEQMAVAIRKAIKDAIDQTIGPWPSYHVQIWDRSVMLHRETIEYDFS